ncbi:MAG: hypothetical protein AAB932_00555, partial [Patescibacteria group bacterium]
ENGKRGTVTIRVNVAEDGWEKKLLDSIGLYEREQKKILKNIADPRTKEEGESSSYEAEIVVVPMEAGEEVVFLGEEKKGKNKGKKTRWFCTLVQPPEVDPVTGQVKKMVLQRTHEDKEIFTVEGDDMSRVEVPVIGEEDFEKITVEEGREEKDRYAPGTEWFIESLYLGVSTVPREYTQVKVIKREKTKPGQPRDNAGDTVLVQAYRNGKKVGREEWVSDTLLLGEEPKTQGQFTDVDLERATASMPLPVYGHDGYIGSYVGPVKNFRPHGMGTMTYPKGTWEKALWHDGGKRRKVFAEGEIPRPKEETVNLTHGKYFVGETKDGQPGGKGTLFDFDAGEAITGVMNGQVFEVITKREPLTEEIAVDFGFYPDAVSGLKVEAKDARAPIIFDGRVPKAGDRLMVAFELNERGEAVHGIIGNITEVETDDDGNVAVIAADPADMPGNTHRLTAEKLRAFPKVELLYRDGEERFLLPDSPGAKGGKIHVVHDDVDGEGRRMLRVRVRVKKPGTGDFEWRERDASPDYVRGRAAFRIGEVYLRPGSRVRMREKSGEERIYEVLSVNPAKGEIQAQREDIDEQGRGVIYTYDQFEELRSSMDLLFNAGDRVFVVGMQDAWRISDD